MPITTSVITGTVAHKHSATGGSSDGGKLATGGLGGDTSFDLSAGSIMYSNGTSLDELPIGGSGSVLTESGGVPTWGSGGGGEVCYDIDSLDEDGLGFPTDFYGIEITDGSSPVFGKSITTVSFWLRINGSPSGDGYVYCYDAGGSLVATSDSPIAWNNLSGSWTKYTFTFATPHTVAVGDKFVIGGGTVGIGMEVSFYGDQNQSQTTFQSLVEYGSGTGNTWVQFNGGTSGARWCYT